MHQLHLVGFTADHDGLIFSTKKGATSGAYVVGIDDALFAALEEARRMAMAEPDDAAARAAAERVRALRPTQRSNLSVRDIQSRLRSGMTLAQVAAEAGVDEDWVSRFAAPVLAEQAAIVERAMSFFFTTPRKGASSRPLGEAVRWNLVDRGISVDTSPQAAGWSAFQLEPGQWAIRFTYTSRGRAQVAEWEVDLEAGELSGRNRLASDLAYVEPGARRRKPVEVVAPAPPPAPPAKKATTGRKGTPARTKTARAQAAHVTSSKAAAARAKAAKASATSRPAPAERAKPASGAGKQAGRAGSSTRQATAAATPVLAAPTGTRRVGRSGTPAPLPSPEKAAAAGPVARFPAPRPAAGRTDGPATTPRPSAGRAERPATAPRAPAARAERPAAPPGRAQPAARQVPAGSVPVVRIAPPDAPPRPRPTAAEPPPRREAPPERVRPQVTADARPMTAAVPGGPGAPSTPPVRRLPPSGPAAAPRPVQRERPAPAPPSPPAAAAPEPEPPAPPPEPPPVPPRPAPAVRPVGGGDGRPTILIIDADRAGDRRRS